MLYTLESVEIELNNTYNRLSTIVELTRAAYENSKRYKQNLDFTAQIVTYANVGEKLSTKHTKLHNIWLFLFNAKHYPEKFKKL